jgi:aminoglycoside phosphotransferase (APT) family kinase protein
MTAVPAPCENWKAMLLAEGPQLRHVEAFGRLLATLHTTAAARSDELSPLFSDTRFFDTLRLEPYYVSTLEAVPAAADFIRELVFEVRRERHTLVHGDYSPKNVLVHADGLVLIDHEVVHWGDPAFDLGFALTHFLSKANHRPDRRTAFAAAANDFWRTYSRTAAATFDLLEHRAVKHTLACLLARVAGRSPLEYLSAVERARQRAAVLVLIAELPDCVEALVGRFLALISE